MKVSSLLVLITSTITGVAAIALPGVSDNTSLKPRAGELFKREICIIENGYSCHYKDGYCVWHKCRFSCSCPATVNQPSDGDKTPHDQALVHKQCIKYDKSPCAKS
ncbi:uncharacterized protein RCO7_10748 [Rhynchosporium graminicola]|uniref:Uncharacterized protein n=1 Tax=Rhynchosporium graminicola TaxID=2792576 RepID=A0A1E1L2M8_9HELO|nr:uncharacterized protein RCO7_10748 [Rhynchosporium commune]